MALGLVAAHRVGVVHRDLKPSNIFLSEDDLGQISAKLVDFGVAKLEGESELTRSGVVLGTPAYMAPEQARESSNAAPQMDVYAVGAVLYRMLSGRPTYDSKEAAVVLRALLAGPPTPLREHCPSLPNEVLALVDKALARDPKNRFASALHLLEAVDLAAQACDGPGAQGKNVREPLALTRTRQNTTLASLSNVGQQLTCFLSTFAQTAWSFVRHAVTIMKPRLAALQRTSALALGRVGVRVRATRQRTANAWRTFVADRTKTENKPPRRTTSTTIVQGPQSQSRDARAELQRSRAKKQAA